MLTSQVHVDKALADISDAFDKNGNGFVAEKLFPVVGVTNKSDKYFKFSKQHFRAEIDSVAPGADARRFTIDLEPMGFYDCSGHALEFALPDEQRSNADPGADLDIECTEKLTQKLLLAEEFDAAALINTTNLPLNATLSGTSQWSDYTNSDPFSAIDGAKETVQQAIGVRPNKLFLPFHVYRILRSHPRVIDRVKYTRGVATPLKPEELANAFEVDEVIVPDVVYQTAHEGQSDALGYIWGDIGLLYYSTGSPARRTPNFGYTFVWTQQTYEVKIYRDERTDSDIYKGKKYRDTRLIEPSAAYLFNTPV